MFRLVVNVEIRFHESLDLYGPYEATKKRSQRMGGESCL